MPDTKHNRRKNKAVQNAEKMNVNAARCPAHAIIPLSSKTRFDKTRHLPILEAFDVKSNVGFSLSSSMQRTCTNSFDFAGLALTTCSSFSQTPRQATLQSFRTPMPAYANINGPLLMTYRTRGLPHELASPRGRATGRKGPPARLRVRVLGRRAPPNGQSRRRPFASTPPSGKLMAY